MLNYKTAIIIPAYNEEKNLIKLIKKINKYISALIVIVDDSQNDKTKKLFKRRKKNILYFHRGKKLGRGSAVIYGLKRVLNNKNIINFIEMDADMSHRPSELSKNIKFFNEEKLDLLIASRYLKKSKIINWPISRRILSKLSNLLARFLLGVPISDYTNGFRIYSKRATKLVSSKCGKIGDGFIVLSEIILQLNFRKYKISETHSVFVNRIRGESSVNLKLFIQSLIGLLNLYLIKKFNKF
jgi:dolichol-phosphate mannosyltransferase